MADHLRLSIDPQQLYRGQPVTASLAITDPDAGPVEVGLVCTVRYDVRRHDSDHGTSRTTVRATAHEEWQPAAAARTFVFAIPRDAPYSHSGKCLSFEWKVVAREPKRLRPDPRTEVPLGVLP